MTATIYIDRNGKEDTECVVTADYRPPTHDTYHEPGENEEINITEVTGLDGTEYDLTTAERTQAEDAIREAAEAAASEAAEARAEREPDYP